MFIERFLPAIEKYWTTPPRLLWQGYRDIRLPVRLVPCPDFHIRLEWSLEEFLPYIRSWSAVQALEKAEGSQRRLEELFSPIARTWGNPQTRREIDLHARHHAGRGSDPVSSIFTVLYSVWETES